MLTQQQIRCYIWRQNETMHMTYAKVAHTSSNHNQKVSKKWNKEVKADDEESPPPAQRRGRRTKPARATAGDREGEQGYRR